jgi:hypothetical protein
MIADPVDASAFVDDARSRAVDKPRRAALARPDALTPAKGPVKLAEGQQAAEQAAALLRNAQPVDLSYRGQQWRLEPCTVIPPGRLLIQASSSTTYFVEGSVLYAWDTPLFLDDVVFGAYARGGAEASHWVVVGQVEVAFLTGLFLSPVELFVAGLVIPLSLWSFRHRADLQQAWEPTVKLFHAVATIRERCPVLWQHMLAWSTEGVKAVLLNWRAGVTAEDVAFLVGRLLMKGAGAAGTVPATTLLTLVLKLASVAGLVALLHAPGVVYRSAEDLTKALSTRLAAQGMGLPDDQALALGKAIYADLATQEALSELKEAADALAPMLNDIGRDFPKAPGQ